MILRLQFSSKLFLAVPVVLLVANAWVLPLLFPVAADDETAADATTPAEDLPRSGVLEVIITLDGQPTATKSIPRTLSILAAVRKAEVRQPEAPSLLVAINVNGTSREFSDSGDAIRVVKGLAEIIDAAKKLKIQLGELGRLDEAASQSRQATTTESQSGGGKQQYLPVNARDGDDGYGIGGGLGGQGGGGVGIANQQQALQLAGSRLPGTGSREVQVAMLRERLIQLLSPTTIRDRGASTVAGAPAPKLAKLGEATLFSRAVHRDYQKATFSFEFGLRDDPTYLHANDWDLQYGNGGDHFHVTMVADDRSRIVDLGKMDWEQLDTTRLAKLPPHPQPRREFIPTALGHVYMVHTVDRNTDLYALFRVEAVDPPTGTCDITWRLVDAPK